MFNFKVSKFVVYFIYVELTKLSKFVVSKLKINTNYIHYMVYI